MSAPLRVALTHDWLTGMRGGERCLESLVRLFPDAEIFTTVHVPGSVSPVIESRPIHVAPGGRLPAARRLYRHALPLLPRAAERLDLTGFDLVVSSSHCVAKGVRPPPGVPHLCYCHTPMRYVWDQFDAYFGPGRAPPPLRWAMRMAAPRLRAWDRASSSRVTRFLANSEHVRGRIRRCYGRESTVVYPPVDVERFQGEAPRGEEYLCLGALVPYKRVDLVVDAFTVLGRPLLVVGEGPEAGRLRARAGPTVRFSGRVPDQEVAHLLASAHALVHAGVEDFGITLVEAQAAGTPVVALAAGGALETVIDAGCAARPTGVLFRRQTVDDLVAAVLRLDGLSFDPDHLRGNARRFAPHHFDRGIVEALEAMGLAEAARLAAPIAAPPPEEPALHAREHGGTPAHARRPLPPIRLQPPDHPDDLGEEAWQEAWSGAREALPVRHARLYTILGIPVRFASNVPAILEAAQEAFGLWTTRETEAHAAEAVEITLLVRAAADSGASLSPALDHRLTGPHRILFQGPSAQALAEPDERRGRGVVDGRWLEDRPRFRRDLLEALTLAVLTPQDRQPLHAAAVVRNGSALLLSGRGGVGKSTLAYAASRAGFRLLSEDTVYLQLRPELRVWGAPGPLHLPAEQRAAFPELAGGEPVELPNGKWKLRLEGVPSAPPGAVQGEVKVCLLRRNCAPPGVAALPPEEVIEDLAGGLEEGFDLFRDTLGEPLSLLARAGGWRIDLPPDPRDAVPWLERIADGTV